MHITMLLIHLVTNNRFFYQVSLLVWILLFYYHIGGANISANSQSNSYDECYNDITYNSFTVKDSRGLIWFTSDIGLFRYNGSEFKLYEFLDKQKEHKLDHIQSKIFEDSESNLYFTKFDRIVKYDRATDQFKSFQIKGQNELFENWYHAFHFDITKNILWLVANSKIIQFNVESNLCEYISDVLIESIRLTPVFDDQMNITSLIGCPWLNRKGIELLKFEKGILKSKENIFEGIDDFFVSDAIVHTDRIFLVAKNKGLSSFKYGNPKILNWHDIDGKLNFIQAEPVDSFLIIPILNGEIYCYNMYTKNVNKLSQDSVWNTENCSNIFIDYDNIWLGSITEGICKYKIENYTQTAPIAISDLISPKVNDFEIVSNGNIYYSTENALVITDSEFNMISRFPVDNITSIEVIDSDNIFLCNSNSIYIFSIKEEKLKLIHQFDKEVIFNRTNYFNEILTFATSSGVYQLKHTKKKWVIKNVNDGSKIDILSDFIDLNSKVDIVSTNRNKLIVRINGQEEVVFSNNYINNVIIEERTKEIFICTNNGLYRYFSKPELRDQNIEFEKIIDGIQIYNILFEKGQYYILTEKGVVLYRDFINGSIGKLNIDIPIFSKTNFEVINDKIWLESNSKLYSFGLENLEVLSEFTSLDITEIQVNNERLNFPSNLNYIQYLNLKHDQNNLKIEVSLISRNPANGFIEYFLNSDDLNETISSKINSADQIELNFSSFGKYKLRIVPNSESLVKGGAIEITIFYNKPYFQSLWFLSLIGFTVFGAGWLINYSSTKKKLKEKQREIDKQKELASQRERIADDLHDELGTELNKILYLSDEAIHSEEQTKRGEILESITKLASDSIKNMRDMLWVLDNRNDNLQSLISRINFSLSQTLNGYNISYTTKTPEDIENVILAGDMRKHILLILKEATNNIVKHSRANQVNFIAQYQNGEFQVSLKDNGLGMANNQKDKGYGLASMQKRAKEIGGDLNIVNNEGEGLEITLNVPIPSVPPDN